jgi:CRP/FNR family transcriptional regulator, cyclic AMP receptor protein
VPTDAGVAQSTIDHLRKVAPASTFQAGQVVYREGDPADGGLLVVSGRLSASVKGPEGEKQLGKSLPGDVVGEAGIFLRGGRRRATLTAVELTTCLRLDRALFAAEVGNAAVRALEIHLLRQLTNRIVATDAEVAAAWRHAGQPSELDTRLWNIIEGTA